MFADLRCSGQCRRDEEVLTGHEIDGNKVEHVRLVLTPIIVPSICPGNLHWHGVCAGIVIACRRRVARTLLCRDREDRAETLRSEVRLVKKGRHSVLEKSVLDCNL